MSSETIDPAQGEGAERAAGDPALDATFDPALERAGQSPSVARAEDRLRRLQQVSLDLTAAVSIDEVAAAVIEVLDAPVAAPSRSLWLCEPAGAVLQLVAQRGMPPETAERF